MKIILAAHGRITTTYRQNIGRGFLHNGVDQGHNNGTAYDLEIRAPADGVVTAAGRDGSYGKRLVIRHTDGYRSLLAHHAAHLVAVGQQVAQGQIVAVMGDTGTKDVHSHQEYWAANGVQLDPLLYLAGVSHTAADQTSIDVTSLPKDNPPMARYIRNATNGTIALANIDTGLWYNLADPALVPLFDARGLWDRSKDLDVPDNEFRTFEAIAAMARGASTVTIVNDIAATLDAAAIAAAVSDDIAARLAS